jgi:nucleoside-diphosphate-sugar epimerase
VNAAAGAVIGQRAIDALRGEHILLAGATGRNGRQVLSQLRELGLPMRAMSRDVDAARRVHGGSSANFEWVEADVTRPATLGAALSGVNVVISAVATARPFGGNRPERVDFEGTRHLIAAAKTAGVRRFVIITSSVSGRRGGLLNLLLRNVLVWKRGRGTAHRVGARIRDRGSRVDQ